MAVLGVVQIAAHLVDLREIAKGTGDGLFPVKLLSESERPPMIRLRSIQVIPQLADKT